MEVRKRGVERIADGYSFKPVKRGALPGNTVIPGRNGENLEFLGHGIKNRKAFLGDIIVFGSGVADDLKHTSESVSMTEILIGVTCLGVFLGSMALVGHLTGMGPIKGLFAFTGGAIGFLFAIISGAMMRDSIKDGTCLDCVGCILAPSVLGAALGYLGGIGAVNGILISGVTMVGTALAVTLFDKIRGQ